MFPLSNRKIENIQLHTRNAVQIDLLYKRSSLTWTSAGRSCHFTCRESIWERESFTHTESLWKQRLFSNFLIRSDECPCISSAHMQTLRQTHTHRCIIQTENILFGVKPCGSIMLLIHPHLHFAHFKPILCPSALHHNFHLFASELTCTRCCRHPTNPFNNFRLH